MSRKPNNAIELTLGAVGHVSSQPMYLFAHATILASNSGVQSVLFALRMMSIPLTIFAIHFKSLSRSSASETKIKCPHAQDSCMRAQLAPRTSIHL